VLAVIEARFDDLTGSSPSFRLGEPVGVLQAMRPDEVPGVIQAAWQAAARGLWAAGFVAYEAAPGFDPALRVRSRELEDPFAALPLAWFGMFERSEETLLPDPPADAPEQEPGSWVPSVTRERYDRAIAEIRRHIGAGDTYQVNHTLRLRSVVAGDERGLYRDLCYAQRGAYGAYVNAGRYRVLSASPELFFRIDGGRIVTKPMKGTAPRGRWPEEDEAIRSRLLGSVKDRAENAMIVDLLRNDLGRIAAPGSVVWSDVFEAERYETVWQLTTTVAADLRRGSGPAEVFAALFPSGSVTGAPKVRTMEIAAGLEDSPRGVYCGAVGFFAPTSAGSPSARFNVAIRTVVVDTQTGTAEYGVGGGITWDSRAANEYDEVVAKARVLTERRRPFALLETLRHDPDHGYRNLDGHLARLRASAGYFGYPVDEPAIVEALELEARGHPDETVRIRLLLDRRGHPTTGSLPLASGREPVRLAIDADDPADPGDVMRFHKTSRRDPYDDARARHPEADDVLLVNTRGEITETTIANVAVKLDGRWWTPPREAGLLPGVERAALLGDGTLEERSLTPDDVRHAEGLAVLSSVRGWRSAELLGPRA
jgi:para-aminobenzoate synthetase / 4-amino-4-deoxychorismate lyase